MTAIPHISPLAFVSKILADVIKNNQDYIEELLDENTGSKNNALQFQPQQASNISIEKIRLYRAIIDLRKNHKDVDYRRIYVLIENGLMNLIDISKDIISKDYKNSRTMDLIEKSFKDSNDNNGVFLPLTKDDRIILRLYDISTNHPDLFEFQLAI